MILAKIRAVKDQLSSQVISDDPLLFVAGISRSGTTLLVTVFDAHPQISLGAELIPASTAAPAVIKSALEAGLAEAHGDFSRVGRLLRNGEDCQIGLFLTRCHRAGVTAQEVIEALDETQEPLKGGVHTLHERMLLAWSIMRRRWQREGTALFGFKLNSSAIGETAAYFPNARFVGLVRDPLDVAYSQQKRGFDRSLEEIAQAWRGYTVKYESFVSQQPDRAILLRYEDLVRSPRRSLGRVFSILPVAIDPGVFQYYTSDATVLKGDHPNQKQLKSNFSDRSVLSGHRGLDDRSKALVMRTSGDVAERFGYGGAALTVNQPHQGLYRFLAKRDPRQIYDIDRKTTADNRKRVQGRSKFLPKDYAELLSPYMGSHTSLRLIDYARLEAQGDDKILLIRHDVDHDIDTAQQIAKWEAEHGLKATYCILHTAWYYGKLGADGRYCHSRLLVDGLKKILEYGHEINFHNNLAALALRTGLDPFVLLEQELEFYDSYGIPVVGSSTHGDALCRELDFRNWEIFKECCDDGRHGGARTVEYVGENGALNRIALGQRSMLEFGLEYEAYDIARDIYTTDSGGNIRTRSNTPGRRPFGREAGRGQTVGVLTHPIWWNFS